jgi:hypothetical protein
MFALKNDDLWFDALSPPHIHTTMHCPCALSLPQAAAAAGMRVVAVPSMLFHGSTTGFPQAQPNAASGEPPRL